MHLSVTGVHVYIVRSVRWTPRVCRFEVGEGGGMEEKKGTKRDVPLLFKEKYSRA